MFCSYRRPGCAIALLIASAIAIPRASAALISFTGVSADGHPVSGSAEFTLGAGTATVKLTNSTTTTRDAGELFTGLDFNLGGLTPSLTSKTGIKRTVAGGGAFTDTGSAQNLSWSLVSLGSGNYQLKFNPDAMDAILGPPTGGSYSGANSSIKGNPGHNPFVAETATFVLSVPGLTANASIGAMKFRFGTALEAALVPEPSCALVAGCALLSLLGVVRRKRV
jgi:hypothetical protein